MEHFGDRETSIAVDAGRPVGDSGETLLAEARNDRALDNIGDGLLDRRRRHLAVDRLQLIADSVERLSCRRARLSVCE